MKPPGNASAPLAKGRHAELNGERDYHPCSHSATFTEFLPAGRFHYAEEVCATCRRHVKWIPRPENIERRRHFALQLEQLAKRPDLNQWERSFLANISRLNGKLSPRQTLKFQELCRKYLEAAQ